MFAARVYMGSSDFFEALEKAYIWDFDLSEASETFWGKINKSMHYESICMYVTYCMWFNTVKMFKILTWTVLQIFSKANSISGLRGQHFHTAERFQLTSLLSNIKNIAEFGNSQKYIIYTTYIHIFSLVLVLKHMQNLTNTFRML